MSEQRSQVSGNARSYQAGHSIHITETAAPAPQALASLPAAPHLTGREEPTAALLKALGPDGSGATVVTGLPGVGKTALALHAAHQAVTLGHFPGGTLFVHLRGYDPAGAVALLTDDPGLPVATLAEDLADTRTRLQTLRHEDATGRSLAVRTAFDLSYRRLRDQDARLFRLLPLNPGPDLSTEAAATLVDLPPRETRASLAALARACLITEHPVGSGRWRLHDLIRLYASELPQEEDRHEAAGRLMIGHYYRICDAADDHLRAVPGKPPPDHFTGPGEALAWLDAERANLIAMVHLTTETAPAVAPYMSASLGTYLHRRRHFHDAVAVNGSALAATRKLDDRRGEAFALRNLGESLQYLRRFEEASTN
ncbi:hypothetical protein ACFWEN_40850, partial [Streptomyces anthocyanicus]